MSSLDSDLARLADGDRAAFEPVFHAVLGPVGRLCSKLLRHDADAADATQEALRKVFERAGDYDSTRPALPWVLAIASWECRTILRRRQRRREVELPDHREQTSHGDPDDLERADLERALSECLEGLNEQDRETLRKAFWEETQLDPTDRKRKQRALERLRTVFRRLYGTD